MFKRHIATFILAALLAIHALAASFTRNPTANETPDTGQGGSAVVNASNTGHDNTTATTTTRTCRWSGFQSVGGVITGITLSVGWAEGGTFAVDATAFQIQYSVNGGGAWTDLIFHANVNAVNSGTATATIPANTALSQIQVRDRVFADAGGTSTITGNVSNIKLTVTTQDAQVVVMM